MAGGIDALLKGIQAGRMISQPIEELAAQKKQRDFLKAMEDMRFNQGIQKILMENPELAANAQQITEGQSPEAGVESLKALPVGSTEEPLTIAGKYAINPVGYRKSLRSAKQSDLEDAYNYFKKRAELESSIRQGEENFIPALGGTFSPKTGFKEVITRPERTETTFESVAVPEKEKPDNLSDMDALGQSASDLSGANIPTPITRIIPAETAFERMQGGKEALIKAKIQPELESKLPKDALDQMVDENLMNGTIPKFAIGKAGNADRIAFYARRAEKSNETGTKIQDSLLKRFGNKADQASLTNLTKQYDVVSAAEQTALQNLDMAIKLASKIDDTGSPLINKYWRASQKEIMGNPELAAFDLAYKTARNEYAKVSSFSLGNAGITEGARHDAASMLPEGATLDQLTGLRPVFQKDMENRTQSMRNGINLIGNRITGRGIERTGQTDQVTEPIQEPARSSEWKSLGGGGKYRIIGR